MRRERTLITTRYALHGVAGAERIIFPRTWPRAFHVCDPPRTKHKVQQPRERASAAGIAQATMKALFGRKCRASAAVFGSFQYSMKITALVCRVSQTVIAEEDLYLPARPPVRPPGEQMDGREVVRDLFACRDESRLKNNIARIIHLPGGGKKLAADSPSVRAVDKLRERRARFCDERAR